MSVELKSIYTLSNPSLLNTTQGRCAIISLYLSSFLCVFFAAYGIDKQQSSLYAVSGGILALGCCVGGFCFIYLDAAPKDKDKAKIARRPSRLALLLFSLSLTSALIAAEASSPSSSWSGFLQLSPIYLAEAVFITASLLPYLRSKLKTWILEPSTSNQTELKENEFNLRSDCFCGRPPVGAAPLPDAEWANPLHIGAWLCAQVTLISAKLEDDTLRSSWTTILLPSFVFFIANLFLAAKESRFHFERAVFESRQCFERFRRVLFAFAGLCRVCLVLLSLCLICARLDTAVSDVEAPPVLMAASSLVLVAPALLALLMTPIACFLQFLVIPFFQNVFPSSSCATSSSSHSGNLNLEAGESEKEVAAAPVAKNSPASSADILEELVRKRHTSIYSARAAMLAACDSLRFPSVEVEAAEDSNVLILSGILDSSMEERFKTFLPYLLRIKVKAARDLRIVNSVRVVAHTTQDLPRFERLVFARCVLDSLFLRLGLQRIRSIVNDAEDTIVVKGVVQSGQQRIVDASVAHLLSRIAPSDGALNLPIPRVLIFITEQRQQSNPIPVPAPASPASSSSSSTPRAQRHVSFGATTFTSLPPLASSSASEAASVAISPASCAPSSPSQALSPAPAPILPLSVVIDLNDTFEAEFDKQPYLDSEVAPSPKFAPILAAADVSIISFDSEDCSSSEVIRSAAR